jgi:acyl CoA:acetate/3-ketoacid CoA transferase alpha subunit
MIVRSQLTKITSLDNISKDMVNDGAVVAIGGVHSHNVPMALVRRLIQLGSKDLTLIGSISAGLPIDLLVGTGCVKKVLAPYVGFEMWGLAPVFRQAVQSGKIDAPEVCEAFPIYTLRAASNGIPFHPFPPGIHEYDDIVSQSDLYQKVRDPFTNEEVFAVKSISPDIALIHVQQASEDGNCIHLGSVVTDRLMATSSKKVIVTCDQLVSKEEIKKNPSLTSIPGIFVDYVIPIFGAAHPTSSHGKYSYDVTEIKNYLNACKSEMDYQKFLDSRVMIGEDEYQNIFSKEIIDQVTIRSSDEPYSIAELIVTVFARDIQNHELGICGAVSDIPMAAMKLAEKLHAPDMRWIAGGSGYINPRSYLVPSSTDYHMSIGAEAKLSMDEVIPIEMQELDFFFAGGIQIDSRGNANLAGIPSDNGWKLRGPGSVGLPFLPRAGRVYLYTLSHNNRTLVEKVAYISGPGHTPKPNPFGGGPSMLVTNLCVFRWDKERDSWKLESIHPNVTIEEVKEATGFEFTYTEPVAVTKIPSDNELSALRSIDPYGYLRGVSP